ncbi:amidase [Histidinibacterium aquaticum]|uniref:Amidase n=1 Tax=Histidinibacterium aquaticum TaxID=2613962 RepID=A0A5J5GCW7_9RHOB|nr:amidase family protein [Histidinibacterium aquaticum]KAA9006005.1 amidase [Histidinibacterium aquaticum]
MDDWLRATAADLGRRIGRGEIDPRALTRAHLDTIESHPSRDRIFARTTPDRALAEAEASAERARTGHRLSPLDGVPVSWKDLFDTAGVATEAGTLLLEGRTPETDARVLGHATRQGLVCLGKTHLSEIAFSGLGLNPMTQTPPNLHDAEAVPGGSTSGGAASVAFGLAAGAIGSDTGGSVRVPAAWNDLVGLKTTHGLLSLDGTVPLCETFDTIGPLARTVEDATLFFGALGGPATDLTGASLEGRRFLVIETVLMADLEEAPRRAFEEALAKLKGQGATSQRIEWPELEEAYGMAGALYTADAWSWWRERVEANGARMFPQIRDRVSAGRDVSASDYLALWRRLRELRADFDRLIKPYDAVLSPTVPILPPKVQRLLDDPEHYKSANLATLRNTRLANLMGGASLTIPTGTPACGLMLTAGPRTEQRLLRLGHAAERALA